MQAFIKALCQDSADALRYHSIIQHLIFQCQIDCFLWCALFDASLNVVGYRIINDCTYWQAFPSIVDFVALSRLIVLSMLRTLVFVLLVVWITLQSIKEVEDIALNSAHYTEHLRFRKDWVFLLALWNILECCPRVPVFWSFEVQLISFLDL